MVDDRSVWYMGCIYPRIIDIKDTKNQLMGWLLYLHFPASISRLVLRYEVLVAISIQIVHQKYLNFNPGQFP